MIGGTAARKPRARTGMLLWSVPAAVLIAVPLVYVGLRSAQAPASRWAELAQGSAGEAVLITLLLAALTGLGSATMGGVLAWLCSRLPRRSQAIAAALLAVPLVIPSYVGAVVYRGLLGPVGELRRFLPDGVPVLDGFGGALVVLLLFTYPYSFLLVRAALLRADPALEQAARGLGSTTTQALFRLTLPTMRPALAAGFAMSALYAVQDFGVVSIMRCTTLTRLVYLQYTALFDRTGAAVTAVLLVLVAGLLLVVAARLAGPTRPLVGRRERTAAPRRGPRGFASWTSWAGIAVAGAVAGVIPVATLLLWTIGGVSGAGTSFAEAATATFWSLVTAAAAGLVALAVTLPIAWLRQGSGLSAGVASAISRVGFALPGIVVALGFVAFSLAAMPMAYQTLPLLVAAYAARFLTQAAEAQTDALARVPAAAPQAARGLGAGRLRVLGRIVAPLMMPGMVAGWALVFVSTMKELPATIILRPTSVETLATEIWTKSQVAAYSEAAVPALVMIGVTALPLWWVNARGSGQWLRERPSG